MMRLYTLIVLFMVASPLFCQVTIEASENPNFANGIATDFDIPIKITLTNTANTATTFTWLRDEGGFIEGWESYVCVNETCYFNHVGTEIFGLAAGETLKFEFHLQPKDICGTGFSEVQITDNNDPSNEITLRFDFEADNNDGSECIKTSVVDFKLDYVETYPNPAKDYFTLTDVPYDLELIHVYNILGSKVKSFSAIQSANYDISDLSRGLYLVNLTNSKGENLNTIKLHKN